MPVIRSLVIAFATYSRIPMPRVDWSEENRRYTLCFFPLIGGVIGLIMWGWLYLCELLSIGPFLKGSLGALLPLMITGGIHMDGFMDTTDALASWQTRERRLEILKDSHVGAFGAMGCAGYLLLSAGLLSEMTAGQGIALIPVFVLSRALSAWALTALPSARPKGMLDGFKRTARQRPVTLTSLGYLVICVFVWGFPLGVYALLAASLCLVFYERTALKHFGGVTGDLAGWFLQIAELALIAAILLRGKI